MHSEAVLPDLSGLHIEKRGCEIKAPLRNDSERTRSAPYTNLPRPRIKRRTNALRKEIDEQTGAYGELLNKIKEEVLATLKNHPYIVKCATGGEETLLAFQDHIENELMLPSSWVQQAPFSLSGYLHPTRITEDKLLDLVNAYRSVRPAGTPDYTPSGGYNLETRSEMYMIDKAIAQHAEHFKPMIDALRGAGFVSSGHNGEFIIKWRFQGARHAYAAVWHMDAGRYSPYADESGEQLREWTKTGTRCVVTAGCVDTTGSSSIYNCGTKVLSGIPVLTENALKNLTSAFLANPGFECKNPRQTRIRFTDAIFNSTTTALGKYTNSGKTFEEAGVQVLALKNGIIATYNDSVFHSGDSSTPEGFQRCFFVACPTITDERNNTMPFRHDATLSDGSKLMFKYI